MKLNNLYDIIADNWKYTILLNIKESTGRHYPTEFCKGLRKGDENKDFVRFMRSLDLNVKQICGGSENEGIVIETEPVYIHKD